MARRRGFVRGGPRRQTQWVAQQPLVDLVTGTGVNLVAIGNAALLELRPFTIVRTHLYWSIQSDQIIASEDQVMAIGCAVVSEQAAAAGVASVPTPVTDQGSDLWYLWDFMSSSYEFHNNTGTDAQFLGNYHRIDSKAQRRVEDGENTITVLESPSFSDGVSVLTAGRFLIMLH